jgi:hypothetical protein
MRVMLLSLVMAALRRICVGGWSVEWLPSLSSATAEII